MGDVQVCLLASVKILLQEEYPVTVRFDFHFGLAAVDAREFVGETLLNAAVEGERVC